VGPFRMLWQIRLPIAWPVIQAGARVSAQLTVGVVAIAAFVTPVGLGNYGYSALDNLGSVNTKSMAIVCIVFIAIVALLFDAVFVVIRYLTTPRGIRA
jgi:osmoprotectant transport system permease protein